MNITLITREGCSFCVKAKGLLNSEGLAYTETQIGPDISREDVLVAYPSAKLLPIFILDLEYQGSYDELVEWIQKNKNETQDSKFPKISS